MGKPVKSLRQKMPFGKYRLKTIQEIIDVDPGYFQWMFEKIIFRFDQEAIDYANTKGCNIKSYWDHLKHNNDELL